MAPRMMTAKAQETAANSAPMVFFVETTVEFSQMDAHKSTPGGRQRRMRSGAVCTTEVDASGWGMQVCDVVLIGPAQASSAKDILQDAI